jgi:hypothetical protein
LTKKNLIIGKTSQLAYYYPEEYVKISARQSISEQIYSEKWNNVYLFFAEQRTSYANDKKYKDDFYNVNVDLTKQICKKINSKKIIFLSTSELWNKQNGEISVDTPWNYVENYYTDSKSKITRALFQDERVTTFFPFNYNSIYRKNSFLFHKIYDSIINKKKIKVGNLNIERELLHASFVKREIDRKKNNDLIGAGKLINIRNFIIEFYKKNNLNYNDFVEENLNTDVQRGGFYYYKQIDYSLEERIKEYNDDIQNSTSERYYR